MSLAKSGSSFASPYRQPETVELAGMQKANCDRCYRRKCKCDRQQPCAGCRKAGPHVRCIYTANTRERAARAQQLERLERRLNDAEGRNERLVEQVHRLRSASVPSDGQRSPVHEASPIQPTSAVYQPRANGVASHASFLSMSAAGDRQYLGSASGVFFADLIRASVSIPVSRHATPPRDEPSRAFEATDDAVLERPGRQLALKLIEAYLCHDFLCYPFLIPSDIFRAVDAVYNLAETGHTTPWDRFVVDMLMAISTTHVSKYAGWSLPSVESHYTRAMSQIAEVLRPGGLQALHAILLLCQYRGVSSTNDKSGSMWHLVGAAARICFELGLHRQTTYTSLNPSSSGTADPQYALQQSKRRSFWCVVALDRITSNILGRPSAIRNEDFDHCCPEQDPSLAVLDRASERESKPFVFPHIVRYRLLCGRIMTTLHRSRPDDMSHAEALHLRQRLCTDLEQWHQETSRLGLRDGTSTLAQGGSCYLSEDWFKLLFANAMLMLWRPANLLSGIVGEGISLQRIFDSSKSAILLYSTLHKTRYINYSWVTLQGVFMAGLSYIYAVSRQFRGSHQLSGAQNTSRLAQDPSISEVISDTRACSNVLVAVSDRWNLPRYCHEVFDRLSDAVLADAVKLLLASQNQTSSAVPHVRNHVQQPWNTGQIERLDHADGTSWAADSSTSGANNLGVPDFTQLSVDNEFMQCFGDLQNLFGLQQIDDSVMELSQDWIDHFSQPMYAT